MASGLSAVTAVEEAQVIPDHVGVHCHGVLECGGSGRRLGANARAWERGPLSLGHWAEGGSHLDAWGVVSEEVCVG